MQAAPTRATLDVREIKRCPGCGLRFARDATFCPFDGARLQGAAFDPAGDPLLFATIDDRYEVIGVLGEGGMGRVYQVRHAALGRTFALKVLRPELAHEEDLSERFIREAKAAASVKHPSVVEITDFGRMSDGIPYFVMELLVGRTLREVIEADGPVPVRRAASIARKVADALGAAHAAGVVHRDLKPDNVFLIAPARGGVEADVDVRVVDFGAAKIVGSSRMTRAGVVFGTPHYMSPEQASGQSVDPRSDVYALGVIMYEMFTGRVPFEADTYMGVLTQHMFVQPSPPGRAAARDLGALEAIVLRCLAKKPEERFASMQDLVEALDTAERGDGAPAPAAALPGQRLAGSSRGAGAGGAAAGDRSGPAGLSLRLLWSAVAVTAIAVAALAARWLSRAGGERPRIPPSAIAPDRVPPGSTPSARDRAAVAAAPASIAPQAASVAPARPAASVARPIVRRHGASSGSRTAGEIDVVGDPFADKR